MYALRLTAFIFVLVGALNWGIVGLFGFDAVAFLFGNMSILSRIVYCLVGLSAIYFLVAELKYLRYKD